MKKIAIVTATRAEYGLLKPLMQKISESRDLELELIVTGAHLSEKQGYTIEAIQKDGFKINYAIPIMGNGNMPYDISLTMANALKGFADCFQSDHPDMIVILGDRTEMLGVAAAAMNERIPIAHIHGGEITEGAVDDCIRHALTKMSYLHFTATEEYRRRVIQLGEDPKRVFNVGALGAENIINLALLDEMALREDVGLPSRMPYAVVTYHPVTLEEGTAENQIEELCAAMDFKEEVFFLITAANADAGGDRVNAMLKEYCENRANGLFVHNLGTKRYLSAVKYASFVLGNSSSGIVEAPVLGTPTVNIGNRQKGRIMAETIICCEPNRYEVIRAIKEACEMERRASKLYGEGNASSQILDILSKFLMKEKIDLKKGFYDL